MRQIKKLIEVNFDIYESNFHLSSNGDIYKDNFFYVFCNGFISGTNASYRDDGIVRIVKYEAKIIKEKFPNARINISFPDNETRHNYFIDGYFGRPALHAGTIILKPIGQRRQLRIKSLLSRLNHGGLISFS